MVILGGLEWADMDEEGGAASNDIYQLGLVIREVLKMIVKTPAITGGQSKA